MKSLSSERSSNEINTAPQKQETSNAFWFRPVRGRDPGEQDGARNGEAEDPRRVLVPVQRPQDAQGRQAVHPQHHDDQEPERVSQPNLKI